MKRIVTALLLLLLFSCSSVEKSHIYNNPKKLIANGDSYSYRVRLGKNEEIEFKGFSGIETLFQFKENDGFTLDLEIDVTKGDFKVLFIDKENNYIEIFESGSYDLDSNIRRIRVAGIKAFGKVKFNSDDIKLKKYSK